MIVALLGLAKVLVGTASVYAGEKATPRYASKLELAGGILLVLGFALIGTRLTAVFA